MLPIIWRTIRDKKSLLAVYLLTGVGLVWMYVAYFPSVQASSQQISDFVKMMPPEFNDAFGLDPRTFTTFEGFIAGKHFSMVWPIMMVMLLSGLAANSIAGEIERGTLELVLSQPIKRAKIVLAKLISGTLINLVFASVSVLSVIPIARAYGIAYEGNNFFLLAAIGFCFGLSVFGLSMLISTFFSEKGKALFLTIGILILMYVLNIVALLKDSLENIKYATLFHYFGYNDILLDGQIGKASIWIFLIVFLICSVVGTRWFIKRDITE